MNRYIEEHLAALCWHVDLLPGGDGRAFIDIDLLLRRTRLHALSRGAKLR